MSSWWRFLCSTICFRNSKIIRQFVKEWYDLIFVNERFTCWNQDQIHFTSLSQESRYKQIVGELPIIYVDYNFHPKSIIWCGKGNRKKTWKFREEISKYSDDTNYIATLKSLPLPYKKQKNKKRKSNKRKNDKKIYNYVMKRRRELKELRKQQIQKNVSQSQEKIPEEGSQVPEGQVPETQKRVKPYSRIALLKLSAKNNRAPITRKISNLNKSQRKTRRLLLKKLAKN